MTFWKAIRYRNNKALILQIYHKSKS